MNNNLAPVVVFAYKRKDKLQKCIESLQLNKEAKSTNVFIFSDGFKSDKDREGVFEVRRYLNSISNSHGFATLTVYEQQTNKGLANSVIEGVTKVINEYGNIIVLEDDLIVSDDFLQYMNSCLTYYKDDYPVGSISAYTENLPSLDTLSSDVYALKKAECWGWATWKDRWDLVDWNISDFKTFYKDKNRRDEFANLEYGLLDQLVWQYEGKSDTWAARWVYSLFIRNMNTIYPKFSRIINNGLDGSGENCDGSESRDVSGINIHTSLTNTDKKYYFSNVPSASNLDASEKNKCHLTKVTPNDVLQKELYELSIPKSRKVRFGYFKAHAKRLIVPIKRG